MGIEGSFSYNRGSLNLQGVMLPDLDIDITSADVTQYTFLVGPRFRLLTSARQNVEVRALVGGSSLNIRVPVSVTAFKNEDFGFAAAFGASYTVVLNDVFSYRVFQPDVLITTAGPGTGVNFRFSTGIVFRYD